MDLDPRDTKALDFLGFKTLKDLLASKLKQTVDPRELVRLNDRLGRVLFKMLQRPEEAIPFLKAALDRDARHKATNGRNLRPNFFPTLECRRPG